MVGSGDVAAQRPSAESFTSVSPGGINQMASVKVKLERGATATTRVEVHNAIANMRKINTLHAPREKIPEVEIFVQAKLREWDKDESGNFCEEEIMCMMEEWRHTRVLHHGLGRQVLGGCCATLMSMVVLVSAVVAALLLSRSGGVKVDEDRGYTAPSDTGRPQVVVTSASAQQSILDEMIAFDSATDNWIISDERLRTISTVSFTMDEATYHLSIAHVIRTDSGVGGETDHLEILSEAGHRIRYWENITTLEVKWRGDAQWHTIASPDNAGARRLTDSEVPIILGPEDFARPSYFGSPSFFGGEPDVGLDPPRGRRAKGMFHAQVRPGYSGAGVHVGRSTGGSSYKEDECWRVNSTHYYCAGHRTALSCANFLPVLLLHWVASKLTAA